MIRLQFAVSMIAATMVMLTGLISLANNPPTTGTWDPECEVQTAVWVPDCPVRR